MITNINSGPASYFATHNLQQAHSQQTGQQATNSFRPEEPRDIVDISAASKKLLNTDGSTILFQDPYSFLTLHGANNLNEDSSLSLSKKDQAKVDALNKQLDQIFGTPKTELTGIEKAKEKELVTAIDKILKKTEPEPLTQAQERQFEAIQTEIDKLFKDGKLTADEGKKLKAFEARLDKLFEGQEPKELPEAEKKQLDGLFTQLDALYGIKQPNKEEISRSEEIFAELDKIYENAANKLAGTKPQSSLTSAEQEKANALLAKINEIFDTTSFVKLNNKDQKQVDTINKQIDSLLGIKEISDADAKKVENIDRKIAQLYEDGTITAEEEKTLQQLDKQLEGIFGKPKELSADDEKKLEALFKQIDSIYDKQASSSQKLNYTKLQQYSDELDALFNKTQVS